MVDNIRLPSPFTAGNNGQMKTTDVGDNTHVLHVSPVASDGEAIGPARLITLLTDASATGSWVDVPSSGHYNWTAEGTWGGTVAQLEWRFSSTSSGSAVTGASLSEDGGWSDIPLGAGQVRVVLTGGTPSAMNSRLQGVT